MLKVDLLEKHTQVLFDKWYANDRLYKSKEEIVDMVRDSLVKYHQEAGSETKTDPYYESTFKTFYEKYGKKVGRVVAYRRWLKLKKSDVEAIMDTVSDFVLANPDPQYRPHPATYLAQKRWLDELPSKRVVTIPIKGRENTWKYEA